MTFLYVLAAALTLLQAFDGWTTYKIVQRGGLEKNGAVAALIERIGLYPALVLVKGSAAALGWLLVFAPVVDELTAMLRASLVIGLAVLYGWVAWHNWNVYRKA